jgi:hypothetical protein
MYIGLEISDEIWVRIVGEYNLDLLSERKTDRMRVLTDFA